MVFQTEHVYACSAAVFAGVAFLTLIPCVAMAVSACCCGARPVKYHRFFFFALGALEVGYWPQARPAAICHPYTTCLQMALFFLFWFYTDSLQLLYILEFLKINQYCLVALFFYGFMARVLDRPTLVEVLLWPIHGIVVILLAGLLGYGLWASRARSYADACETPAWLAMSSLGAILGIAFLVVAIYLQCRVGWPAVCMVFCF
jgi:hypothetical protein